METECQLYAPLDALERFQHHDAKFVDDAAVYTFPWGHVEERRRGAAGLIWEMHVALAERIHSATWSSRFQCAHDEYVAPDMYKFLYWRRDSIEFESDYPGVAGAAYMLTTDDFRLGQLVRIWVAEQLLPVLWPRVMLDVCGVPPRGWEVKASR